MTQKPETCLNVTSDRWRNLPSEKHGKPQRDDVGKPFTGLTANKKLALATMRKVNFRN